MIKSYIQKRTGIKVLLAILFLSGEKLYAQDQPNILWIIADDLGKELGCYGNQDIHTPNIDPLVCQGIKFNQAYATDPVCSPSRSALIAGMYSPAINCQNHRTIDKRPLPKDIVPITQLFQ